MKRFRVKWTSSGNGIAIEWNGCISMDWLASRSFYAGDIFFSFLCLLDSELFSLSNGIKIVYCTL